MSNIKELMRQEIERRKKVYLTKNGFPKGTFGAIKIETYEGLLAFIGSLPEEKPSEDLVREVKRYYFDNFTYISSDQPTLSILTNVARHFAEWQKKHDAELIEIAYNDGITIGKTKQKDQMTKDAVEGEIGYWNQTGLSIRLDQSLEKLGYDEDTKVKIIIVKQDE